MEVLETHLDREENMEILAGRNSRLVFRDKAKDISENFDKTSRFKESRDFEHAHRSASYTERKTFHLN